MHRIDTVNARPNQNGAGKAGFNDNTDLAGQDATYLDPAHLNAIQEEVATVIEATGTPLEKGTNHQLWTALNSFFASNTALDEVDSRLSTAITTLAAAMQQAIIDANNAQFDKNYPIGTGTIFNLDNRNPSVYLGRGVWEAFGGGTHLSFAGTSDGVTLVGGTVSGSHTHTMTAAQMPEHDHVDDGSPYNKLVARITDADAAGDLVDGDGSGGTLPAASASGSYNTSYIQVSDISPAQYIEMTIKPEGEGEAMPIRPRTTTVYGWLRMG